MEKEFLYVGHYIDHKGRYILKIGTTNDLKRRAQEHNHHYRKAPEYTMPKENRFEYDWHIPLSKYNTLRYEDKNRERWQDLGYGTFVKNDRFCCPKKPDKVSVCIRKEYIITLGG